MKQVIVDTENTYKNLPPETTIFDLLKIIAKNTGNGGGGDGGTVNQGEAGPEPWPVAVAGTQHTPTLSFIDDTSGTVAAGQTMVSIKNIGEADGIALGATLPVGETVTWQAPTGTIGAVAYDATNTVFLIATL